MEDVFNKMRSTDRVLVLKAIEGVNVKTDKGLIDNRLFTEGKNEILVEMDGENLLWSIKYKSGILPEPLRQRFTSFKKALEFASHYFERRGLKVIEVKD